MPVFFNFCIYTVNWRVSLCVEQSYFIHLLCAFQGSVYSEFLCAHCLPGDYCKIYRKGGAKLKKRKFAVMLYKWKGKCELLWQPSRRCYALVLVEPFSYFYSFPSILLRSFQMAQNCSKLLQILLNASNWR